MSSSQSGPKLFIAFAALGGAFLLAHPYRVDGRKEIRVAQHTVDHVALRETAAPGDLLVILPDAPTAEIQPTLLAPPPEAVEQPRLASEVSRLTPPPLMARTYPGSTGSEMDMAGLSLGHPGAGRQRTIERTHEVRDGDTLEGLAQHYLGDRARWPEIYQINRDRIQQPEPLPLAATLVIPPKFPRPSSGSLDGRHGSAVAQAPLVPVVP